MTEKVSAKPMNCSNTAEIFRTNEALNLMAAEETNVGEMVQRAKCWLSLLWRRMTHRIDPRLVDEAHIQAASAKAKAREALMGGRDGK